MAAVAKLNFDPIRDALYDWIYASINGSLAEDADGVIQVIRAEDDEVRPSEGFVEYKFLTSFIKLGRDELRWDSDLSSFFIKGQREFTVSINVVGEKSHECAAEIIMGLESPTIRDVLCAAGLAFRGQESFQDVSQFLETDHEERQVLDFRFGVTLEKLDAVTTIDSVELTNKLGGLDTEFTVTIN